MKSILSLFIPVFLFANPQNAEVISGTAQFEGMNSSELTVHPSDRAIIHWDSFSIDHQEITHFVQGGVDAAVLNRVTTEQVSHLMGTLQADGKVYLINPNGIVIGKDGVINAGSFIGSSFDISDDAFLAGGDLHFIGNALSSIVNEGNIEAHGGNILLFAHRVENQGNLMDKEGDVQIVAGQRILLAAENQGSLFAKQGDVQVAEGHRILLAVEGKELLLVQPELPGDGILNEGNIEALRTVLSSHSNPYELGLRNRGEIEANSLEHRNGEIYLLCNSSIQNKGMLKTPDGKVYVEAGESLSHTGLIEAGEAELIVSGANLESLAIQMEGIIHATGMGGWERSILLIAKEGIVSVKGSMTASNGGTIHALGKEVRLEEKAILDASGKFGGGEVLVGGGYQGKNPEVLNAQYTFVGADATVMADGLLSGNGGKVILWGDDACHFGGKASARGGKQAGNGGLIEVSSHRDLLYQGLVDTKAPQGKSGTLLLDPSDITITNSAGPSSPTFPTTAPGTYNPTGATGTLADANILTALTGSNNVQILTSGGTGGAGTVIINGTADGGGAVDLNWTQEASLTITADRNIEIHAGARIRSTDNDGAIILTANGGTTGTYSGIVIEGDGANPTLEAVNSAITLTGTGGTTAGANTMGVRIGTTSAATILSGGFGGIQITGTGGTNATSNANGIQIENNAIVRCTGAGGISLDGTGGTNNTGAASKGVVVIGTVNQQGTGGIGITGVGISSATGNDMGIEINGGTVSSSGGNITLNGSGPGGSASNGNQGIVVQATSSIIGTNTAAINLTGNGGGNGGNTSNQGVLIQNTGIVATSSGAIGITGVGGAGSSGTTSSGIENNGSTSSTTGNITASGTATTQNSNGILLNGANALLATPGTTVVTADGGAGAADFRAISNAGIPYIGATSAGDITFNVDSIDLGTTGSIRGVGNLNFVPRTNSTSIGLGGGSGILLLTTTDVARLVAGFSLITVGGPNVTGDAFMDAVTFTSPLRLQAATMRIEGALNTGANDLTVLGTGFNFNTGSLTTSSGNILIGPQSTTATLGLGTGTGTVNIPSNFLGALVTASGTLQFGRSAADSGDNVIDVNTTTVFADPIAFFGRDVTISGALSAGASNISFSIAQTANGEFTLDNTITGGTVSVTGGAANNTIFDINQTGQTLTLTGGASGTNTLEGPNGTNAWSVTSTNGGTMSGGGTFTFTNIQNMTGGTGNDTFTFNDGITIAGALNGGTSGTNTLNLSLYTSAVSVSILNSTATGVGSGFSNLNAFTGPTGQSNNLAGPNASSWTITGADNAGTVDGNSFVNFPNLTGGTSDDTFTFIQNFFVTGSIDGGSSGTNTLNFSAHTNPTNFNLQTATGPDPGFTFTNIDAITGSSTATSTLTGANVNTNWNLTANDTGTLSPGPVTSFTNFSNLTGGTMSDTFIFADSTGVTGAIDGGSTGSPPTNTLDYSSFQTATVNFNAGTEDGTASNITGGFTQIQSVTGFAPPTPPSPSTAPLSSTSPFVTVVLAANATTSSDFFGGLDNGAIGAQGSMGPVTYWVSSRRGFIMKTPSFVQGEE